ncbi:iron-containing alcohol dehydrogenase family protein [Synechococcus sp. M16CYN]|uniref:iron-containing alcohol dehydrogenase family protein n=1 Tax=Synechococcus sp. M16CYN TaxID=3103139 RepID=UPI0032508BC2
MVVSAYSHALAPTVMLRGQGAWGEALSRIAQLSQKPLVLGRSQATESLRKQIIIDLQAADLKPTLARLHFDCCEEDLCRLVSQVRSCDAVVATGGGKVLDAGKLLAHRLNLPCITVPLSAATCAGWTALSNLYSPDGAFKSDITLDRCPDLLVFDHSFVRQAPTRTLASGIADALAKWYEASVSSGDSSDGLVQQAVQMARLMRDQLLIDSPLAIQDSSSAAWARTAEACALTAGIVGGLGGARCRTVAAHAVHNGLTQLRACNHMLHGEKVGFGILVQLRLEEELGNNRLAAQARRQLMPLLKSLGLPVSLNDLGLAHASQGDLQAVCAFACQEGSDLHHLPFSVTATALLEALLGTPKQSSVRF